MCNKKIISILFLLFFSLSLMAQVSNQEQKGTDEYIAIRKAILKKEATAKEPHWYLKTNTVGLAMLIANVAVEFDLGSQLSLNLPVYYSAWDYFSPKTKFRTFLVQPELRYWVPDVEGLFVGVHAGLAWFNYAMGSDFRYQDHDRHTPIYGGGLNVGYRRCISKDKRWFIEFSLGGGVYALNYDKFHNEENGAWISNHKRTFYGVDNVAVSFAYQFDLKKKK